MEKKIILTEGEEKEVIEYLKGGSNCRRLGVRLGMSHQGAIGLVTQLIRQWYQEGKIKIK